MFLSWDLDRRTKLLGFCVGTLLPWMAWTWMKELSRTPILGVSIFTMEVNGPSRMRATMPCWRITFSSTLTSLKSRLGKHSGCCDPVDYFVFAHLIFSIMSVLFPP